MHRNQLSLGYWTLGAQYLRLAHESCTEIVNCGNKHCIVSKAPLTLDQYDQATRWSDHSVGVAILFNFFHGIELILKGFLTAKKCHKSGHCLTKLLKSFEDAFPGTGLAIEIRGALAVSCKDTPIGRFMKSNSIEIDRWYEALKYPESRKGQKYTHIDLKYGGSKSISFWNDISRHSKDISEKAVKLSRSLGYATAVPQTFKTALGLVAGLVAWAWAGQN